MRSAAARHSAISVSLRLVTCAKLDEALRVAVAHLLQRPGGRPEVLPRHQVGEGIVVDDRVVFVRACDAVNAELAVRAVRVEAQAPPHPRRLDQYFRALLVEEVRIACDVHVFHQGIRDVCVDVVLRCARGVVGGGFLPVDGPPREQGSPQVELTRAASSGVQHAIPEPQEVPCDVRVRVNQEGQDVDLGVPEIMALVSMSGQALGRQAHSIGASAGLMDVEDVEARHLLKFVAAPHLDVGPIPELVQVNPLTGRQPLEAEAAHAIQGSIGPLPQLVGRCVP